MKKLARFLKATPARIFQGRAGLSYKTEVQLKLRVDHAFARDAVMYEASLPEEFILSEELIELTSEAVNKSEYLLRPDLGRKLSEESRKKLEEDFPKDRDVQIIFGDGLSALALNKQSPVVFKHLKSLLADSGLILGHPFFIRHCRVGIMNDVGVILRPKVVVLLIGERPGLMTAESLSVYMAYRPDGLHTDANRNLISNIHERGLSADIAAKRIFSLIRQMLDEQTSGFKIKEFL